MTYWPSFDAKDADRRLGFDPRMVELSHTEMLDRLQDYSPADAIEDEDVCRFCGGRGWLTRDSFGVYDPCDCNDEREGR